MSEQFNPEWEYWVPDEEIQEIAFNHRLDGFDGLSLNPESFSDKQILTGIRFGKGNPDNCRFKLGKEKRTREYNDLPIVKCVCGELFKCRKRDSKYCSIHCRLMYNQFDAQCSNCYSSFRKNSPNRCIVWCSDECRREILSRTSIKCMRGNCKKRFNVSRDNTKYCSHVCYLKSIRTDRVVKPHYKSLPEKRCANTKCKGVMFQPSRSVRLYCSKSCASLVRKKYGDKECAWFECMKRFVPVNKNVVCCSKSCSNRLRFYNAKN